MTVQMTHFDSLGLKKIYPFTPRVISAKMTTNYRIIMTLRNGQRNPVR